MKRKKLNKIVADFVKKHGEAIAGRPPEGVITFTLVEELLDNLGYHFCPEGMGEMSLGRKAKNSKFLGVCIYDPE